MRFVGDIALDAEVRALASGAITDGASVIVNADGTVSGVSSDPDSLGDQSSAIYSGTYGMSANVYDTGQDKVLFIYSGPSNYGYSVVGTVSGSSISFGTPVVFSSATTYYLTATFDSNAGKTGIFWADYGDSTKGKACVATISGTSVSYGTTVTFNSNSAGAPIKDSTYDTSENKILVAYTESSSSSKIIAATISGTDISFGTPVEFLSTSTNEVTIQYDTNVDKSLVAYRNSNNSNKIDSRVVSLSGTSVTLGSETNLYNAAGDKIASTYDSTNNKIVVAYRHDSALFFVVPTISGTSVSYGTEVTTGVNFDQSPCTENFSYNVSANKVIFAGRDGGNSYIQKYVSARVSGTSISMDTPVTYYSAANDSYQANSVYDPDQEKTILFYADGTAGAFVNPVTRVLTLGAGDNITSENFIGFAHAAYADGQKATVKTTGSIARNVPQVASASDTLGDAVTFHTANVNGRMTYDSNSKRIVLAYKNGSNSGYGTAVVGTSGTSPITFGTPVVYESANTTATHIAFDSNVNRVLVAYKDEGNSDYGTAIVGNVDPSDNSISFGTPAVFHSSNIADTKIVFDSNINKFFISFRNTGDSNKGKGVVATIDSSDNSVTFGSVATFHSGTLSNHGTAFDSNVNKIFISFADSSSGDGSYCVGTISGTSISFSTVADFIAASAGSTKYPYPVFDSNVNRIVIFFSDGENSDNFSAIVGTVAANSSVSLGTKVQISTSNTQYHFSSFDTNINKIFVTVNDGATTSSQSDAVYYFGTVDASDNSISFSTKADFVANTGTSYGAIFYNYPVFDSDSGKTIVSYATGDFAKGQVKALTPAGTLEDLTIGQQYFVQTDGTLGTSADDPSVIAGTAIGTSDIIVKG